MMENIDNFLMWESTTKSDCFRIHHGRGGTSPSHVSIDWYPPHLLITLYKEDDSLLDNIKNSSYQSIFVQHRYLPRSPWTILKGDKVESHLAHEAGLKYHLNFFKDQNIGFFMDMREGRRFVRDKSCEKKVLNLFSYSCSFSVAAIAGGATEVINIDVNSALLNLGRENHRLNHQDCKKIKFFKLNILKSWGRLNKMGPYDLIIVDPPSFQKDRFDVEKNYPKVLQKLKQMVSEGGIIVACLNAPYLTTAFLRNQFEDYTPVKELFSPKDFFEQNREKGLKICAFQKPVLNS